MRAQRIWFITCAPLIFVLASLLGWVEIGVGQDGYVDEGVREDVYVLNTANISTIGAVSVSPAQACIGQSVLMSGTGQKPSVQLSAYMSGTQDTQSFFKFLGTASTDAVGSWHLTFAVPSTVTRQSDGADVPTFAGKWPVGASVCTSADGLTQVACDSVSADGYLFDSFTYLEVTGECVEPAAALPNTGFPVLAALLGAPLVASGGAAIAIYRRRRGHQA